MLRDYLTVCPNGFTRDPHPRPFDDLCSPSQEPSARAGQGMVAEDVDEPAASGRGAAPLWTEGEWEAHTATQGKLHCVGDSVVAGSAGMALTRHPRAAQLESARARRRWAAYLVATCARGSVGCEFATHCAASHAASRRGPCQSLLVGGRHPRLLARTGTPASLQLEAGCVPPLRYGGTSLLCPFPPAGGRMPRPKPGRTRQSQGLRQPMPPSTLRARYGPRWLGRRWESRQFPCAVRLTRRDSAEAGLQGLPHGVVVRLGVAGYIQRRHRAELVVGPRRGRHSEEEPRTLQVREARQLAQKLLFSAHPAFRP